MKPIPLLLAACAVAMILPHRLAADTAAGPGATVVHDGKTHELRTHGRCGAGPGGAYNIWAVTPDETEPSVAKEGAPRLHATSNGEWSMLEFYESGSELTASVRRDGADRIGLDNGELRYDGPVDGGAGKSIEIHLRC